MITIKMQPNSEVVYHPIKFEVDDCLMVDNYPTDNQVWHIWLYSGMIEEYKTSSSIGVWRIKQQKLNH